MWKLAEPSVWSSTQANSYSSSSASSKTHTYVESCDRRDRIQEHRSTVEQIFTLQQLVKKHVERQNKRRAQAFIDFKKAFDYVWHVALFHVLYHYGIPTKCHNLIANLYNRAISAVKCSGHVGELFTKTVGSRQGCRLSPDIFNIYIENIMSLALNKAIGVGVLVGGHLFNNLQFADDIALLAGSADNLQHLLDSVSAVSLAYGMEISRDYGWDSSVGRAADLHVRSPGFNTWPGLTQPSILLWVGKMSTQQT